MNKLLLAVLFLVITSSCNRSMLSLYTDYVTIESLASYHVDTPDPLLDDPPFEQRLTLEWAIPNYVPLSPETHIALVIRFRNREEATKTIYLKKRVGRYTFILSDAYFEKRGILTYKATLSDGNCVLEEWKHLLWAELILLNP